MDNEQQIIIYTTKSGQARLEVKLKDETVWLNQAQIAELFGVKVPAISKHVKNIFTEKELDKKATISKMETVQKEGSREIRRNVDYYNLDMIISVGYRVNSQRATNFRIWATRVLRDHILKGFTLNESRLQSRHQARLKELQRAVGLLRIAMQSKQLDQVEASGLLDVITEYADSWILLQQYDEKKLTIKKQKTRKTKTLSYQWAREAVDQLQNDLTKRKQASNLFGRARGHELESICGNLEQSFGGKPLYRTLEEKAAHLLYFVVKDHPFIDGNKRSAALLFILFLQQNNYLFDEKGERKINDNALVALTLLVAESKPRDKEIMVALITNLL